MEQNCRMCLIKDQHNQFQRFSHKLGDALSVYDYYKLFTSITFKNQDERIKSKICFKCLQKLFLFYNDRSKAITNNEILLKWCNDGEYC